MIKFRFTDNASLKNGHKSLKIYECGKQGISTKVIKPRVRLHKFDTIFKKVSEYLNLIKAC